MELRKRIIVKHQRTGQEKMKDRSLKTLHKRNEMKLQKQAQRNKIREK